MAVVNQVEKRVKIDRESVVKFQLLTHCFLADIPVSSSDLLCLTHLALEGEQELNAFCNKEHSEGVFKSSQTVRNAINKAEKRKLVIKEGKSKKKIFINPELKIQIDGTILLDYKILSVAP